MRELADALLGLSPGVRYVALYLEGELGLFQREGIANASAAESDRYEELIVNPALLTLARQRGEIDCGGLEYLLIRYGSFFQTVHAVRGGHVSVAVEPDADPLAVVGAVRELLRARAMHS